MELSKCLEIVDAISDADRDMLLERLDSYIASGMAPAQAQRMAVDDLIAEVAAEDVELRQLLLEQHPDLADAPSPADAAAPAEGYKSKFFTDPTTPRPDVAHSRPQADGPADAGATKPARAAPFHSALMKHVEALPVKSVPPVYWQDSIRSLVNKGAVKAAEVEWSAVHEWLGVQAGRVDKQQILDYLADNGVQVDEVVRTSVMSRDERARLAQLLQREGRGELLTASEVADRERLQDLADLSDAETNPQAAAYDQDGVLLPGGERYRELLLTLRPQGRIVAVAHPSAHWTNENVLASLLVKEHADPQGRRVLVVEALQSDWASDRREGRKAPDAPFVGDGGPNKWLELAVKRVVKLAVDEGFDRVAFTTGEQNAKRFELRGANAKGMRVFYDTVLPNVTGKALARLGGGAMMKVDIVAGERTLSQPGFGVTPAMREAAAGDLPLFSRADRADQAAREGEPLMSADERARLAQLLRRQSRGETLTDDEAQERNALWDLADVVDEAARSFAPGSTAADTQQRAEDSRWPFPRGDGAAPPPTPPGATSGPMRQPPAPRYRLRPFGRGSAFIEALQDRYNRWKHAIADVKAQGGFVTEANDFYRAEERYWGKVGARLEDFQAEVDRFIHDIAADRLDLGDVALYAYAMHAKERNAYLRGMRSDASGFDSWSGMTDAEAQAILDDARLAGLVETLERHRRTLQGWIQGTRDLMRDEGLVTQDEHARLSAMFENYVPLRGMEGASQRTRGTGQGFDVRGTETRRAFGRRSEAQHVIEHVVLDRARTLVRAGKNEVLRSFLAFVLDNPSPNLWEVNAVESRSFLRVDDDGNQVIEHTEAVITDDRTVAIKDGGRAVYVQIKDPMLLEQIRNLHVQQVGRLVGVMLMAQRALGRLYTTLSPIFTVMNWARDVQAATIGMLGESGVAAAAKLWAKLPHAIAEVSRGELLRTPSPEYQLFRATGGKTGFMDFKDVDALATQLERQLANAQRAPVDPRVWGPTALELMDRVHSVVENSTRFAAFLVAREEGRSVVDAARIAKNLTVNFNRKGTLTPQLSAWFLFFNPAVQGTARVAQALRSPKVLAALGAGMAGVAMLALRNADMGDDDDGVAWWDKIPSDVKDRNLVVVLPPGATAGAAVPGSKTGRYIKIPMPYGWNFFATLANQSVDVWRGRQDPKRGAKPVDATLRAVTSLLGAYSPVSDLARSVESPKSAALAAVPDFANPIAQSLLNVGAFGKPLFPDDPASRYMPDASKAFAWQHGTAFQRAAEGLNELTGGSRYRPGLLDFTPGTIENLVRAYGGGPASFSLDLLNSMYLRQAIKRTDLEPHRLPFVKQLYGAIDAETDRVASHERMEAITRASALWERALREGRPDEAKAVAEEYGEIARMGAFLRDQRQVLTELRKQEMAVVDSDRSDDAKYARLLVLDARKRVVLQRINRQFDRAIGRASGKQQTQAE